MIYYISNQIFLQLYNNLYNNDINEAKIKNDILKFNPELIISFNNVTPEDILEYTNCPILVYNMASFEQEIDKRGNYNCWHLSSENLNYSPIL